jgi:hypothetical protein
LSFFQLVILPTYSFAKLLFHQLDISSADSFANFLIHPNI